MSPTGAAAAFAFVAGLGGALQIAVQARLGERVGTLGALACAGVVAAATATLLLFLAQRNLHSLGKALWGPKWLLLGGVMSAVIVLSITVAGPRIGVVATTALLIAGQFVFATVIDRLGLFGVERVAIGWPRLVGLLLLAVGAALTLRR